MNLFSQYILSPSIILAPVRKILLMLFIFITFLIQAQDSGQDLIADALRFKQQGKYLQAIENFQTALSQYQRAGDRQGEAIIYQGLGNLYLELSETERSIDYFDKALSLCQSASSVCPAFISYNLFQAHLSNEDAELADHYLQRYIELNKNTSSVEIEAYSHLGSGQLYILSGNHELAIPQLRKSIKLFEQTDNSAALADAHLSLATILPKDKQPSEVLFHLRAAERLAGKSFSAQILANTYLQYSNFYDHQGNHKLAYLSKEKYSAFQDSLFNSKTREGINLLNDFISEEQQKKEVILLEQKKELSNIQLQSERSQTWINIFGILLLGLLGGFSYNEFRKGRERNISLREARDRVQKMLAEREFLLAEVHHRVKNNMQIVTSLLRMQRRHLKDPLALKALQEGQDRIQTMALLHQFLYKDGDKNMVNANAFFQQLIDNISQTYANREQEISIKKDLANINLSMKKAVPISLILTELLTNAFKYGFVGKTSGEIYVSLIKEEEHLQLRVEDNGIGMPDKEESEITSGFGFTLIRSFTKKLKADLQIESKQGTSITLLIKS